MKRENTVPSQPEKEGVIMKLGISSVQQNELETKNSRLYIPLTLCSKLMAISKYFFSISYFLQ